MNPYDEYEQKFGPVPMPTGIPDDVVLAVVKKALKVGEKIPDDFDWYSHLPEGANT